MLLNFFTSDDCTICDQIWPKIEELLTKHNKEFKLYEVGKEDTQEESLEIENTKQKIPAFPALVFIIEEQSFMICGSGILNLVKLYIKDEIKFFSHIEFSKKQQEENN